MPLVLNGDGNITGLTPGGLPDASITQSELAAGVAGNGPAFSAYLGSNQSLGAAVYQKMFIKNLILQVVTIQQIIDFYQMLQVIINSMVQLRLVQHKFF